MPNLKYSNSMGHLIMSILTTLVGLALALFSQDPRLQGIGVTLILTVNGVWFISGASKQTVTEVVNQLGQKGGTTPNA